MSDEPVNEKSVSDASGPREHEDYELQTYVHPESPTKESNPSSSTASNEPPTADAVPAQAPRNQATIHGPFRIASDESTTRVGGRRTSEWVRVPAPPPLPYSLYEHKLTITIFWFLILAESCFIPISFYYGLWFGTNLRHGALFAIITSVFGFVTGYEYCIRGWKLLKKSPEYRPRGSPRWGLDTVQWSLSLPYFFMTVILIAGSIPTEPLVRVLAIPLPIGFILLGIWLYASAVMYQFKMKTPIRLSSTPKGVVAPPLVYHIIEDVVAVDGGGRVRFRDALHDRFEASPRFRRLLWHLTMFWGLPTAFIGAVLLALIFTVQKEVAYGLGWGVPTVWAAIWTVATIVWVRTELRLEHEKWEAEGGGMRFGRSLSLPVSGWHLPVEERHRGFMGKIKRLGNPRNPSVS